jgi:hypothetical protein
MGTRAPEIALDAHPHAGYPDRLKITEVQTKETDMLRHCVCAALFLTGTAAAVVPLTRPASQPATRPAEALDDENDTGQDDKYVGPENVALGYEERQAYQKELKAAAKVTLPGIDRLKKARDDKAKQLAEAQDGQHADGTARFLTQGTRWRKPRGGSSANLSNLRKALAAADHQLDLAEDCEAVNAQLRKLAVHYKYQQYRTAWTAFRAPVHKMNSVPDQGVWSPTYPYVLGSYRNMKAEAHGEYDVAYDKFIRPMKVKKDSLLAGILRDTGVPKEPPRGK